MGGGISTTSQTHKPSDYNYAPLRYADSIRLLSLLPGDMESPIQIRLAEVRSRENSSYEALSYTWATEDGDCSLSSQIRCGDARLWVTKNCELALRYLRKRNTSRTLWVDAICINQKDCKERGHQVGIMQDVYSKATGVLIWLGEASNDLGAPLSYPVSSSTRETAPGPLSGSRSSGRKVSIHEGRRNGSQATLSVSEIFLEFLGSMNSEITRMQKAGQDPKSSPRYRELLSGIRTSALGGVSTELCRGFFDIVKRRWWSRVWVIQEVVVAKSATLICSKQSTNYSNLFGYYELLTSDFTPEASMAWEYLGLALTHLRAVHLARHIGRAPETSSAFLDVLLQVRNLSASNPRDKIFGILGLSDQFQTLLPLPDYQKTTTEVFLDVSKSLLKETRSLSILVNATSATHVLNHPSWVPYWSNPPVIEYWKESTFQAARRSDAIFAFSSDDQELRVKGHGFDRVKKLPLAGLEAYGRFGFIEQRIPGWRLSCDVGFSLTKYPTGEHVEDALWRTLCWNTDFRVRYPASNETGASFREWYHILTSTDTLENIKMKMSCQENPFEAIINYTAPLCTTANGYLAAVPYTTEVGDCIAILAGGAYPFVLRPVGDHYRLVGPCYVHGIMNGEAFPEDPEELKWFSIR